MSENYSEEIGIFTIECRKLIDNSWKINLKSSGLLALIVRFDEKEDEHDIAGMWYDDLNDILYSAYTRNKRITYIGCSHPVEVVGKHKNGNWLIEVEGSIVQAVNLEGISIVKPDKSSAQIKAELPLPIKVAETQRVWFIRSAPVSNQLVVDSRNAHPAELHVRSGNCFRTKKDAQAWIDALTKLAGNEE